MPLSDFRRPRSSGGSAYTVQDSNGNTGSVWMSSDYTQFTLSADDGSCSYSGSASTNAGVTTLVYTATTLGTKTSGSVTKTVSGSNRQLTCSNGSSVQYSVGASTASGSVMMPGYGTWNASATRITNGFDSTYSGPTYSRFRGVNTTADGSGGTVCPPRVICQNDAKGGLDMLAQAFGGAAFVLGFLPGMQGFAVACAGIGLILGLIEMFAF
jgi:hypothetical protein